VNSDSIPPSTISRFRGFLGRWFLTTLAVWAACLVPGVHFDDVVSLLVAALILGILNTLLKPILVMLALPLVVLTLGFMMFAINAFLLMLTSKLVPGFHVDGFWAAVFAALIISVVNLFLGANRGRTAHRAARPPSAGTYSEPVRTRTPPPGKGPIIDV